MLWNKQSSEKKIQSLTQNITFIFISANSQKLRTIGGFSAIFHFPGRASRALIVLKFRVTMQISLGWISRHSAR